jgi:hypothetical protein
MRSAIQIKDKKVFLLILIIPTIEQPHNLSIGGIAPLPQK